MKLNYLALMDGIGICTKAVLNRAGEQHVNICMNIDNETKNKGCMFAYNNYFGTNFGLNDILTFDFNVLKNIHIHLCTASFPSNAFTNDSFDWEIIKQKSLWDKEPIIYRKSTPRAVFDCIETLLPDCFIVDGTFNQNSEEQRANFELFRLSIESLGYNSAEHIYKAYNYNAPQDRERSCTVFFRNTLKFNKLFDFPKGTKTPKVIGDILLDKYDEKYIISQEAWNTIYSNSHFIHKIQNKDTDYINTITANYNCHNGGYSAVVRCEDGSGWRFLTPLEIFRAMGLKDDYYYYLNKLFNGNDDILYRLAGNSMIGTYIDSLMQNLFNILIFRVWEQ